MKKLALIATIFMVVAVALFQAALPVAAVNTAWYSPSANEANTAWTTPENTYASDDSYMTTGTNLANVKLYNFNLAGISGAIAGIEVDVEANVDKATPVSTITAQLMYNGRASGAESKTTPSLTLTDTYYTLGSSTDTWLRTWSGDDFKNANFAVKVTGNTSRTISVDHVRVRVYCDTTWQSYQTSARTTVWGTTVNPYDSSYYTAYMKGEGFLATHDYKIGYYDNSGNQANATEAASSDGGGVLTGAYNLMTDTGAAAGTWHAVVIDTTEDIPGTYALAKGDPNYVIDDEFEVLASAIPEFPTIMAAIGVAGLCFGIYYWMRKRVHRVRGVH